MSTIECVAFEYVVDFELERQIFFADKSKIVHSFVYGYNNKTFV